jgi:hypothetical protein
MNTFEVFEQFRGPFGEEPARALAHTLGAMFEELKNTGTKEDFQGLEASLDTNVSRLESAIVRLAAAAGCSDCRPARLVRQKPLGLFLRVRGVPPSPCRRGRAHQARRKPRDVSSHPADPHHKYGALARDGVS